MKYMNVIALCIVLGLLSSCDSSQNSLTGKYSSSPGGEVVFEISQGDTSLMVQIFKNGKALADRTSITKLSDSQLEQGFGEGVGPFLGTSFGTSGFVVAEVADDKGFESAVKRSGFQYDPEADFFARVILLPINAYKID